MARPTVTMGNVQVSKLIIGANPFSGFSHQCVARDDEMRHFYTVERIKKVLRDAQALGINTHMSRADHHVMRYLMEFWDEGGTLQWFAQTCPELGPTRNSINNAVESKAKACYIHGGVMDNLLANGRADEIKPEIAAIKAAGMAAGVAGHNPAVFEWAEKNLDVDFYMCCYYNPTNRAASPEHVHGATEWFNPSDRDKMVATVATLSKPAIHYKVLAAGRTPPKEAFAFVAKHLRSQDAVCIGVFPKDRPDELKYDVDLLMKALAKQAGSRQ